jgi:glycosyltransferase involved in cell wall biosynthesis
MKESPQLPDTAFNGSAWPKISIVTPSYNQGQFIEETIRSVLLQGYPNLEYVIIDGGSTDNTVEIIKKYEPWLAYWESVPDRGQSHAINKGFAHATGEIFGWLNSDDLYTLGSLRKVAASFIESKCDVLSGNTIYLEARGRGGKKTPSMSSVSEMLRTYLSAAPQPSTFWTSKGWDQYGPLDEDLHYRMDYALFLCFAGSDLKWISCNDDLALFRHHQDQKTWSWSDRKFHLEKDAAIRRFAQYDNFSQRYSKEIKRGLYFEGWLVSWMAVNLASMDGTQAFLKLLTAPFYNWRCLFMLLFYRKALGKLFEQIRRQFFNNTKRMIQGGNNTILYDNAILSSVTFDIKGEGNKIEIMEGCVLKNLTFYIKGNNHKVFMDKGCEFRHGGSIWIADSDCSLIIGEKSTFEDVHLALTEPGSQIAIGRDCMFAYDIDVRTGDSHSIISLESNARINYAENVFIGDHVWVGAHSIILKGVSIPDNSVVATGSVVTRSFETSGIIVGGNPATIIKKGITWSRERIRMQRDDL